MTPIDDGPEAEVVEEIPLNEQTLKKVAEVLDRMEQVCESKTQNLQELTELVWAARIPLELFEHVLSQHTGHSRSNRGQPGTETSPDSQKHYVGTRVQVADPEDTDADEDEEDWCWRLPSNNVPSRSTVGDKEVSTGTLQ